jgi:chemotaxis protein MotA
MNFSSLVGFLFGCTVLYFALSHTTENILMFLDFHGILIVCGGTAAASSISFPIKDVFLLSKVFVLRVLGKNNIYYGEIISELIEINKKASISQNALNEYIPGIKNLFLKESVVLMANGVLTDEELRQVLSQRLVTTEKRYFYEANMFRTIGKYPPAFGLLATTLGMIALLQKIGQPDSQKLIGPAMSIGLIGTLYGIALANLIFLPIAENLTERTYEESIVRKIIIQGVLLIKKKVNPIYFREYLNSYLLPKQRISKKRKTA